MQLFLSFILRAIFIFIRDAALHYSQEYYHCNSHPVHINNHTTHVHKCIIFYIYIIKKCTDKLTGLLCFRGFPQPGCKVALFLSNYCILANYSWLLVEGHYLHSLIILSLRSQKKRLHWYILLGWGRVLSPESIMTFFGCQMLVDHFDI